MTEELLLCPFCNGKAILSLDDDAYYCEDCGAMPYVEKGCDPVDVWNTRPRIIPKWLKLELNKRIETSRRVLLHYRSNMEYKTRICYEWEVAICEHLLSLEDTS